MTFQYLCGGYGGDGATAFTLPCTGAWDLVRIWIDIGSNFLSQAARTERSVRLCRLRSGRHPDLTGSA